MEDSQELLQELSAVRRQKRRKMGPLLPGLAALVLAIFLTSRLALTGPDLTAVWPGLGALLALYALGIAGVIAGIVGHVLTRREERELEAKLHHARNSAES
jgi:protein-S-isoprenylcysteine O-methyltransferase Ste14